MMRIPMLGLVLVCLLACEAAADVVTTEDGRRFEGLVREIVLERSGGSVPGLEIVTLHGTQIVARAEVASWERRASPIEEYLQRRENLVEGFAESHYALARWCEGKGLREQALAELQRAHQIDPADEKVRRALGWRQVDGEWIAPERLLERAGFVRHQGRWMLPAEVEILATLERADITVDEIVAKHIEDLRSFDPDVRESARAALAEADPARILPELLLALKEHDWHVRAGAAQLLGTLGGKEVEPTLFTSALADRAPEVREAAIAGLREGEHPDAYAPFVKALASEEQPLRVRGVQALAQLGDDRAVSYLVKHVRYSGGGPRVHMFVGRQVSYISDYDVEVAQESQIADPIVSQISEGIMLDVRFAGISGEGIILERRLTSQALSSLTGVNATSVADGELREFWGRWWREHRHEYEPGGERYRP